MSPASRSTFVLAAGGTGGHLFPAQALAEQLVRQDATVHLLTDRRADAFTTALPGVTTWQVRAGRIGGGPIRTLHGMADLTIGLFQARRLLRRLDPDAVIGFGGYPSVPTMLAAAQLHLPTAIHEQNAVLGRANRLLARRVGRIATGFADIAAMPSDARSRAIHTGNPVRPAIRELAGTEYRSPQLESTDARVHLLVIGGSQGARVFADIVPAALAALPERYRAALRVSQQARPEDCDRVSAQFAVAGIAARVQHFFDDVPARLAKAQLVICRAGASTVAELAAIGRPALLIPYPHAADDHQSANARAFAGAGGGWIMPQPELTAPTLTSWLTQRLTDAAGLQAAAAQARRFARDDAAERLAALVLGLGPALAGKPRLHAGERAV